MKQRQKKKEGEEKLVVERKPRVERYLQQSLHFESRVAPPKKTEGEVKIKKKKCRTEGEELKVSLFSRLPDMTLRGW